MSTTPKTQLDARGLSCPLPVVKARQEMEKLSAGDLLEIVATDPGSAADFPAWARRSGHELLESDESDGVYTYLVRKGA